MRIIKREIVFDGKFLKISHRTFIDKTGKERIWESVERKNIYGRIVIIFALTKNREVLIEKVYRVPLESYVLELPAGLVDKKGESETETAKRELLEETGFFAKKLIPVFGSVAAPGLTNSEYLYFFAPDVEFKGKSQTEDTEEIEVLKVPLNKLTGFLLKEYESGRVKVDDKILNLLPVLQFKKLI